MLSTGPLLALLLPLLAAASRAAVPRVGDSWGTNIHFMSASPAEAAQVAAAYRVARMDFKWAEIEKSRGVYDFAAYDGLLKVMEEHKIRPYWILDYGNSLYPYVEPPSSVNCSTFALCNQTCGSKWGPTIGQCTDDGAYYCCGAPGCSGSHKCASNPHVSSCYCDGKVRQGSDSGCDTPECIAAFGNFAQAAVDRCGLFLSLFCDFQ